MSKWDVTQRQLPISISTLQLGPVGLFFHPSELFSYYGLSIRHHAPQEHTIAVGYTDGFVGYLTDPTSHKSREYAAAIVPKVLDLPPYVPTAARDFTGQAIDFLKSVARKNS